jgi:hypothetical protein
MNPGAVLQFTARARAGLWLIQRFYCARDRTKFGTHRAIQVMGHFEAPFVHSDALCNDRKVFLRESILWDGPNCFLCDDRHLRYGSMAAMRGD